jgi:hypothetical protein
MPNGFDESLDASGSCVTDCDSVRDSANGSARVCFVRFGAAFEADFAVFFTRLRPAASATYARSVSTDDPSPFS